VFNSGLLQLEGGVTVEGESLVLNSTAVPAVEGIFGESYWGGRVSLLRNSVVGAAANSLLQLAGVISGTGHFTKVGAGTLRFGGGDHNTYDGVTFVNEGVLLMSKPNGITAVPSTLIIGTPAGLPATAANLTSYQVNGGIIVNRGGLLNLNGQVENVYNMVLNEGGDVQTGTGVLFQFTGGGIFVFPGAVNDPATISGNLDMDAGTHILDVAASDNGATGPHLEITALITSSFGAVTLQKNGAGTLRLSADNSYSGTAVVNEGVLRVDGFQIQNHVQVNAAGTFQGVGRVNNIICGGGVIAPGASPGVLGCEDFNVGSGSGILEMELNGPMLGASYDNLYAGDTVNLSGITLRVRANFSANTNQQFVLINNAEGGIPVQGTFNGLPQNATVTAGDQIFRISYFGGDGNDVVLTKIADVYRPPLTIQRVGINSVRLLWPTNDPAFVLQSSTNLSGGNWTGAAPSPSVTGTNNVVTNATGGALKFYRVVKP
jgi:autotransporter-associated beta strand protein